MVKIKIISFFKFGFIGALGCSYAKGCRGEAPAPPQGAGGVGGGLERPDAHR